MGCHHSKAKYIPSMEIPGQDVNILPLLRSIGIEEAKDIDMFYAAFFDMDVHHTGFVRPVEMYTFFGADLESLESALFGVFDDAGSGKLDFVEFVCSMWNFLSARQEDLAVFFYLMKDPTGVMRIKYSDLSSAMEIVHKRRVDSSSALTLLLNDAKEKLPAEISLSAFVKWAMNNLLLISPMLILQIKIRKRLLGEKYWVKMTEKRVADEELTKLDLTKKLQKSIDVIHQETKDKKAKIDKGKLKDVKESMSASQKNIQQRETALMDNFLKRSNSSQVIPQSQSSSNRNRNSSVDMTAEDSELDSPVATTKKTRKSRTSSMDKSGELEFDSSMNTTKKSRKNRPGSARSRPQSATLDRQPSAIKDRDRPPSAMKDRPQSGRTPKTSIKKNISFRE